LLTLTLQLRGEARHDRLLRRRTGLDRRCGQSLHINLTLQLRALDELLRVTKLPLRRSALRATDTREVKAAKLRASDGAALRLTELAYAALDAHEAGGIKPLELHASRAACCSAKLTACNISLRRADACQIWALQRGGRGAALGRAVLANTTLHALHAGEVKTAKLHASRATASHAELTAANTGLRRANATEI